ncbi:MAG TPA: hypothetical protein VE779_01580 [Candidatus Angelobacter sp.]|nr:hypothetical protein [Candidatus Angelobacter sp.]
MKRVLLVSLFCFVIVAVQASGATVWTQFNNISPGTVTGTMGGVTVTYTSTDLNGNTQINDVGTNYWLCGTTYCPVYYYPPLGINPPNTVDMVSLNGTSATHTITFSSPVSNPVMALISLGDP